MRRRLPSQYPRHASDETRLMRARYGSWYGRVVEVLAEHDPAGLIAVGAPEDEYEPEARTIVPRVPEATSAVDLCRIIHEEFVKWFGQNTAGTEDRYAALAAELWSLAQDRGEVPAGERPAWRG